MSPLLAGVSGVVLAHTVDYVLIHPDGADRAHALHATGHAYWPAALALGLVGGLAALIAAATRGACRGLGHRSGSNPTHGRHQLVELAGFQIVLFAAVEVLERWFTGAPLHGLATRPEFLLGILLQVFVVVAVHKLLSGVESVAESLAAGLRTAPARAPRAMVTPRPPRVRSDCLHYSSVRPRGPPSLAR